MLYIYIWAIVAVIILSTLCYTIGAGVDEKDGELPGLFFVAIAGSIFWPVLLAIAIVAGPFFIPYKLGARHRQTKKHKEKMWQNLKT